MRTHSLYLLAKSGVPLQGVRGSFTVKVGTCEKKIEISSFSVVGKITLAAPTATVEYAFEKRRHVLLIEENMRISKVRKICT